jgi:hypothetical protein
MITFSSFNNNNLLPSIFVDCCMLIAGSGASWRPASEPSSSQPPLRIGRFFASTYSEHHGGSCGGGGVGREGGVDEQSQRKLSSGSKVSPAKKENMRQRSNSPKCVSWASPCEVNGKKIRNDMQELIRSKNMDRQRALVPSH